MRKVSGVSLRLPGSQEDRGKLGRSTLMGPVGEDIIAEPEDLKVTWPSSDWSDPLPEGRQRGPHHIGHSSSLVCSARGQGPCAARAVSQLMLTLWDWRMGWQGSQRKAVWLDPSWDSGIPTAPAELWLLQV